MNYLCYDRASGPEYEAWGRARQLGLGLEHYDQRHDQVRELHRVGQR